MRTCKHDTKGRTWEQEAAHSDMSVMRESDRETREKMEQERRHREVNKHGDQTETKQPQIILNRRINNIIRNSKAQENYILKNSIKCSCVTTKINRKDLPFLLNNTGKPKNLAALSWSQGNSITNFRVSQKQIKTTFRLSRKSSGRPHCKIFDNLSDISRTSAWAKTQTQEQKHQ